MPPLSNLNRISSGCASVAGISFQDISSTSNRHYGIEHQDALPHQRSMEICLSSRARLFLKSFTVEYPGQRIRC
jgi:hypothetical protein